MEINNKGMYMEHKQIMSKYPSIGQFRQVIKSVESIARYQGIGIDGEPIFDRSASLPTLPFTGTVKLHGTNAGVGMLFEESDQYWCQSRENIITPLKDNAGFATFIYAREQIIRNILQQITSIDGILQKYIGAVVFGELCGGNIQKSVAINGLPKMFVVFSVKLLTHDSEANEWLDIEQVKTLIHPELNNQNIYGIYQFPTYSIDIDFEHPEITTNTLVAVTEAVEVSCPIGEYFGIKNGTGEGVVWRCDVPPYNGLVFKVKGKEHQNSKVRTLAPVDIERVNSITECVEQIVTDQRLKQGLEHLTMNHLEFIPENLGVYLKWVTGDCIKEELDTIVGSGLIVKDVTSAISKKARNWFFETTQI